MTQNNEISNRQLRLLLILQMFSTPILMMPRIMANEVMQDGWLVPIIGLGIGYIYVNLITRLTNKFKGDTIVEFAPKIVNKYIAHIIVLLFAIKIIITTSFELRLLSEIVNQILLPTTPTGVIMLVMLFTVAYLVGGGIEPYGRMAEILVFVVFIPIAIVFAFIVAKADYKQLIPVFQSSLPSSLRAGYYASLTFMPLEFVLIFAAFIKKPGKIKVSLTWVILAIFIIETITIMLTYIGIGVLEAKRNYWPVLALVQSIQFPGAFIENQEIAMFSCWILSIFMYICGGLYSASLLLARSVKLKKDNFFILPLIPIIYIISMLASSFSQVYKWNNIFRMYTGALYLVPIPLLFLIVNKYKKAGDPY